MKENKFCYNLNYALIYMFLNLTLKSRISMTQYFKALFLQTQKSSNLQRYCSYQFRSLVMTALYI